MDEVNPVNANFIRTVDVFMENEDGKPEKVYSETESVHRRPYKTRGGIAGAVNLLYGLLLEHENVYYLNDYPKLSKEMTENLRCRCYNTTQDACSVGKHLNLFRKIRLQLLKLQIKFLNIFK